MRRIRGRRQRRAPQLPRRAFHRMREELAAAVEPDQLRHPAPRPALRVDHDPLPDRDQHLRRRRIKRQRPPHHQPREPILDHRQPRPHQPPAVQRHHLDLQLVVIGLPHVVARLRLPASVDRVPPSAVLAVTRVCALSERDVALQRPAERRVRRHRNTLVAQQMPCGGRAPAGAVERLDRLIRRPPPDPPARVVAGGRQPPPHRPFRHAETLRGRAHHLALKPSIRAQRQQPGNDGLPALDDLRTHVKPHTPQQPGRRQPVGAILHASSEVRTGP